MHGLNAAPFSLVEKGSGKAEIQYIGEKPEVVKYVSEELQRVIKNASGAELEMKPFDEKGGRKPRIVIGNIKLLPEAVRQKLKLKGGSDDELLVKAVGNTLYMVGPTDRAAAYSVYSFLEEIGGVRWLWPGETGEIIPTQADIIMPDRTLNETPGIRYRSLALSGKGQDEAVQTWLIRNRANVETVSVGTPTSYTESAVRKGFIIRFGGHCVELPSDILKANPDYVALVGGQRRSASRYGAHLCWSNPSVQEELVKTMSDKIRKNPEIEIMGLYTADQGAYCECESCIDMAKDVSTRWQKLSAILLKGLRAEHPNVAFWTLAYDAYRPLPSSVADYDHIVYTIYNASYRYPFSSGSQYNAEALNEIKAWQGKGAKMGFRQYEMISLTTPGPTPSVYNTSGIMPLVYFMTDQMAYAQANSLTSYISEIFPYNWPSETPPYQQCWNTNRLNVYTAMKAMWNPSLTAEQILADWTHHAYGPAADEMKAYYTAVEKAWKNAPGNVKGFHHQAAVVVEGFISKALIKEARQHLAAALEKVEKLSSSQERVRYAEAVALDTRMFQRWEMYSDSLELERARYSASAPEAEAEQAGADTTPLKVASTLPPLQSSDGKELPQTVAVESGWDSKNFYVHLTGEKQEGAGDRQKIELLLGSPFNSYAYRLTIGSDGQLSQQLESPGKGVDRNSNLNWSASIHDGEKEWSILATIPLAEIGIEAPAGKNIALGIQYGEGDDVYGWPGGKASFNHFGEVKLAKNVPPKIAIYDLAGNNVGIYSALRLEGWDVKRARERGDVTKIPVQDRDMIVIRYGNGDGFNLPGEFVKNGLKDYVKNGGLLVISTDQTSPLESWFSEPSLKIEWSGKDALRRESNMVLEKEWLKSPNDIASCFWRDHTPVSGFIPTQNWTSMAEFPLKDGRNASYFLYQKYGKGTIILTTSSLGHGGGFEMFGDRNTENVRKLLENLAVSF